jgi:hypothetical protein
MYTFEMRLLHEVDYSPCTFFVWYLSKHKDNFITFWSWKWCDLQVYRIISIGTALNWHANKFLPNLRRVDIFL